MFKNLENMMKGFQNPPSNNGFFDFNKIKKYLYYIVLSIFLSGFGVGILVGLMF
jgi:hypothetical protein